MNSRTHRSMLRSARLAILSCGYALAVTACSSSDTAAVPPGDAGPNTGDSGLVDTGSTDPAPTLLGRWKELAFYTNGKSRIEYPYDGNNAAGHITVVNEGAANSPSGVMLTVKTDAAAGGMLNSFPNGGKLMVLKPGESTFVTNWFLELFQRPATPFQKGETRAVEITYHFESGGESYDLKRTYEVYYGGTFGEASVPAGSHPLAGTIALPSGVNAQNVKVSLGTRNWGGMPLSVTAGASAVSFATTLPDTNDWYLHLYGAVKPVTIPVDRATAASMSITAEAAPTDAVPQYELVSAVNTDTGFWRGAASESEQSVVVFPGQENWNAERAEALKKGAKIYKYSFSGTKLWEYTTGWEAWGGDMSRDGAYVAYALYTGTFAGEMPPDFKVEVLNGKDGSVLWTKTKEKTLESYEVAISNNNEYLAVGTTGSGQVSLYRLKDGTLVWTMPGANEIDKTNGLGQVRRMRFDASDEYLYAGSGDNGLRKIKVSDGSAVWKSSVGGWPFINGMDFSPDGSFLAIGMKSARVAYVRASDGNIMWAHDTGNFDDAFLSPDGKYLSTFSGKVFRADSGQLVGHQGIAVGRFTKDSKFVVRAPGGASLNVYNAEGGGSAVAEVRPSGPSGAKGEQAQWMYLSKDDTYAISVSRDMTAPPQVGLAFFRRK